MGGERRRICTAQCASDRVRFSLAAPCQARLETRASRYACLRLAGCPSTRVCQPIVAWPSERAVTARRPATAHRHAGAGVCPSMPAFHGLRPNSIDVCPNIAYRRLLFGGTPTRRLVPVHRSLPNKFRPPRVRGLSARVAPNWPAWAYGQESAPHGRCPRV